MPLPKIIQNIFSLTAAEVATKGITFFLFAYLARVLSVEGYGIMSNIIAIIGYLNLIVVFGLNDIAIRSTARKPELTQKYFANITTIKVFFAVISFFLLLIYVFTNDFSDFISICFVLGGIQLFAIAIHIEWIFIATERLKILAVRQILIASINLIGVLLFVKSVDDLPLYFVITSLAMLLNNSWLIKFANVKIKLECDFNFIKSLLKQSTPLWFSTLFSYIMGAFGIIYLAQTTDNSITGLFAAANKFFLFTMIPAFILLNSFSSRISQADSIASKIIIVEKYCLFLFFIGSIISAVCFVFADLSIFITFGADFIPATNLLKILSFSILCFYVSCSAVLPLRLWGDEKRVFISYILSAILLVGATIILSDIYSSVGTAVASVLCELSLAIISIIFLYRSLGRVFILRLVPFLLGSYFLTLLLRNIIELFSDNIYFLFIGILLSVFIYFFGVIKLKIIDFDL